MLATAPATTPRTAVAAVDSLDGSGGGVRSRRRRIAAERTAVFFRAVLVAAPFRGLLRVVFLAAAFRGLRLVAFFATLTSATTYAR
jgi:hypothetical protein